MNDAFDKLHKTAERALQEIDRLMAENARLTKALHDQVKQYPDYSDIARKALEKERG